MIWMMRASSRPYALYAIGMDSVPSMMLAYLPWFTRMNSHAVRFQAKDMVEASRIMQFVGAYEVGLTP